MKNIFAITCLSFFLILSSCSDDEAPRTDDDGGGEPEAIEATYRLTFNANFTPGSHPNDYPAEAAFGPLFGIAHSPNAVVYREGQLASNGFKSYVETGDLSLLTEELTPTDDGSTNDIVVSIATANDISATSSSSVTVTVTPSSGRISFLARLSPSPDWFVGVDSFNLLGSDNLLIEDATIELFPFDAGVDAGTMYNSEASPNSETITPITGDPFTIDNGGFTTLNPLGTLRIERLN